MADGNQDFRSSVPPGGNHPKEGNRTYHRWVTFLLTVIILLLLGLLSWWLYVSNRTIYHDQKVNGDDVIEIPLGALKDGDVSLLGTGNLTIQGSLRVDGAFTLSPSAQPSNGMPGQIYYDASSNQLKFYDGKQFVSVATGTDIEEVKKTIEELPQEQSGGGDTHTHTTHTTIIQEGGTDFTPGSGLSLTNGVLSNTGVTALQGQTGELHLVAGGGIAIDGLTISNTGVRSIIAGANITVSDDGNGNITINSIGGGGGTVSSPGGTPGAIAMFTGVQEIADSIMTESGGTITVGGNLSVTGDVNLTNPLSVGNGGTGTTSLANNGVVIGQGANALTAVTAAGPGLCFMSTAGAPEFTACPSGGVTSLNGTTGDLTIANTSTAGTTITIDDASTTQKGIAQFNSDNFTTAGGVVNTIQDINTAATPTFAGVNTNNITPSGALTVGATNQSFTLQGSAASTITATDGANTTTLNFAAPTGNNTITLPDESGTVCMQNSTNCGFASASNAFIQGGNDFGATALLGTTGSNSLELITDNTTRLTIDPTGAVSNEGSLRNAGPLAVGGNSSVSSNTLISLDQTYTSGTVTGVNGIIRLDPAVADSNYHTGMRYQLQTASGNVQNFTGGFRGITAFVEHNGTGTMNEAWGAEFRVDNSSTGTINSAVGLRVQPNNNSGGGTIVDNYGLFIDSQAAGTNNFALYTNSGTVRFGDTVQLQTLGTANTNTHLCRNSANQIATCSDSGSNAFVQGGNGFGATAVLGTTDANSLQIVTGGNTQATIAVNGAATFQNSANSTGAFRVLNAASVPLFQVDTTNNRVYIGNVTPDGTGALLVLDNKNTPGDPTGVAGGMYYNNDSGAFRCFEQSIWTDCLGMSKPNTMRTSYFVADGDTSTLGGYGDVLTNTGSNSGSWDVMPYVSYTTGATSGNSAGVSGLRNYMADARTRLQTSLGFLATQTNRRIWMGFTDATQATMAASATPSASYAAFRLDTSAGDTNWQCVTDNGSGAPQVINSGVPPHSGSGVAKFEILNLVSGYVFKINGRVVCNNTSNLPSSTLMRAVNSITTLTNQTRSIEVGWIYTEIIDYVDF